MMMETVFLLAMTGLVAFAQGNSNLCPSDGYFPSKLDCKAFYHCVHGEAKLKVCPPQMHWKTTGQGTGFCDLASVTPCRIAPGPDPIRAGPPQPFRCPVDGFGLAKNGLFGSNLRCNQFYMCVDGTHHLFDCPRNMLWSQVLGHCDHYSKVACALNSGDDATAEGSGDVDRDEMSAETEKGDSRETGGESKGKAAKSESQNTGPVVKDAIVVVTTEDGSGGETQDVIKPETDVRMIMQEEHLEMVPAVKKVKPQPPAAWVRETKSNKAQTAKK